jgi:NAD(P)-dependent dehydrogenase (short-subunit alcohol dehydrogenase family)
VPDSPASPRTPEARPWRASIAGRVVVVTGARQGLGRSYARWFAANGARVVVNGRPAADGGSSVTPVVEEIRAAGGTAVGDDHSIGDEAGCRALIDTALSEFGQVDTVVCNAAISKPTDVDAPDLTAFRDVMEVNFWGSVNVALTALPHMLERGWGRIVLTMSSAGLFGDPGSAYYAASKSAILGFVRSIAADVDARGVRVNLISPSAFTSLSARFDLGEAYNRAMSPDLVAPVVGWLSSDGCDRSGLILHAGCGRVRRIQVMGGPAVDIPDGDVEQCWPQLEDMSQAREAGSSLESGSVLRAGIVGG